MDAQRSFCGRFHVVFIVLEWVTLKQGLLMAAIYIQLLGMFRVTVDGEPITKFRSDKARALLAYVAAQGGRAHSRSALATLFWPEIPETKAKQQLRNVLSNIRKVVPNTLVISRQSVTLGEGVAVDSTAFEQAIALGQLEAAVNGCGGAFLRGFTATGVSAEFDDWLITTRESLHIAAMQAYDTLLTQLATQQAWQKLIPHAQKQLQLEAWHEPAHCQLMQAFAALGQLNDATAQYEKCVVVLQKELDVEPAPTTRALFEQLLSATGEKPRHNLPKQITMLFGRNTDIDTVYAAIQEKRLVTLLGMGGVGKTRMSIAAGERLVDRFEDGVWFVSLVGVSASHVAMSIMTALDLYLSGTDAPIEQLTRQLRDKKLLLIIDNVEQVAERSADFLLPLLEKTNVHILLTSRQRVHVGGEHVIAVRGLPLTDAVALFHDRAPVPIEDESAVQRICDLVQGLPLGIELSAHWTEHFSAAELADLIADSPHVLKTDEQRHGSLRAVFDHSWAYLSPAERSTLAQMSVFRGAFGRKAVLQITEASLSHITQLIHKSLVQRVSAGRYQLHEVVREFSAEKLPPNAPTPTNHAKYYLNAIEDKTTYKRRRQDLDNVRAAWQWVIATRDFDQVAASAEGFKEFMKGMGLLDEVDTTLEAASKVVEGEAKAQVLMSWADIIGRFRGRTPALDLNRQALALTKSAHVQARLHGELGRHLAEIGPWTQADMHFQAQTALAEQLEDESMIVVALGAYAQNQVLHFAGDYKSAIARLEQALSIVEQNAPRLDNRQGWLYHCLNLAYMRFGDYAMADVYAAKLLQLSQTHGNRFQEVDANLGIGLTATFAGQHRRSIAANHAALTLAREIEDKEGIALLTMNLGLAYRRAGELQKAREYGESAECQLSAMGIPRMLGQAQNRLAHTLAELTLYEDAYTTYQAAHATWLPQKHPNIYEAKAGLGAMAAQLGRLDEARELAIAVFEFANANNLYKVVEPILLLGNCVTALRLIDEAEKATAMRALGQQWIDTVASRISQENFRTSYLTNIRAHQQLLAHPRP